MSCCQANMGASLGATRVGEWNPQPNVTTVPLANGANAPVTTGTATARAVSNGSMVQATRRLGYVSAAAINSVAGGHAGQFHSVTALTTEGTGRLKAGGFKVLFEVAITDAVLNPEARMFFGTANSIAVPTAVDPATLPRVVGFGCNAGDTTLRVYATDNVGGVQTVNLGANFPVNGIGADQFWRGVISCPYGQASPGNVVFDWMIERVNTGHQASGRFTGAVAPPAGNQQAPRFWRATGPASALAVGIDLCLMRWESIL